MPKVLIENLTFPPEEIHLIKFSRNKIRITLKDLTLQKKRQYEKWINLCGTMHQREVEQVSIGKNHYENKKFLFTFHPSRGTAGITPYGMDINLELISEK